MDSLISEQLQIHVTYYIYYSELRVDSIQDFRTGGRRFDDPWPIFLMMVIVAGFIPLPYPSIVSAMAMWESSQWLRKNIVRNTA